MSSIFSSVLKLALKLVRNALGYIILFFDKISRPKSTEYNEEKQMYLQEQLMGHSLYQLKACPFCVKTRRAIHKLGINVELRDINKGAQNRQDLESGGGRVKVPCLRIDNGTETQWMYESNDIIEYLEKRVA